MKHYPAAFINTIAESGTKEEAIEWLQKVWNELCWLKEHCYDAMDTKEGLDRK